MEKPSIPMVMEETDDNEEQWLSFWEIDSVCEQGIRSFPVDVQNEAKEALPTLLVLA